MAEELPTLTIASSDRILTRPIETDPDSPRYDSNQWEVSSPIPGAQIINTWQIYNRVWIVLTKTEDGHYNLFRTINQQSYKLVHSHASKIYGLYYIDDGHAIFCAEDGWWKTTDTGANWEAFSLGDLQPIATAMAIIWTGATSWILLAYAKDHKVYRAEYPGGEWTEAYDATGWKGKWYPAIAGGPVGVLAGAGNQLLRSDNAGGDWYLVQTVSGTIKSILISNQTTTPTFLITVEQSDGERDLLYWTYDLGDTLEPELSRDGLIASVQSVVPTGSNELQTSFAVLGKRAADGTQQYKIIEG